MNTFDLNDLPDPKKMQRDVVEALELAESIEELAGQLPEEGEEFGMSVTEKAEEIALNIDAYNRVTDAQLSALENMLDGLQRWFHD